MIFSSSLQERALCVSIDTFCSVFIESVIQLKHDNWEPFQTRITYGPTYQYIRPLKIKKKILI